MVRSAEQTTQWVAGIISKLPGVGGVAVVSPNSIRIPRDSYGPFVAGIISVKVVTVEILQPLLDVDSAIEIIANVPKESAWTGTAIKYAADHCVAFGGIKDLMSAVTHEDVRGYIRQEYGFVERGLTQHSCVSRVEREFDRVYQVHRRELPPLRFVMLNEYTLTGEHVRTARCRYGAFDAILISNPNGGATAGAREIANSMGIDIFK